MGLLQLMVTLIILRGCYAQIRQNQISQHLNRPIVGGKNADILKFPYQVSLQIDMKTMEDFDFEEQLDYLHFCGGSIISVEWVLTAAHCTVKMDDDNLKNFIIRAGTSLIAEGGHLHEIAKCIINLDFKRRPNVYDSDVAVLKVKKPFEFGPTIQPIALNKNPIVSGGIATVSGWGTTTMGGDRPTILQKVSFPILPHWECQLRYRERIITQNMICAGRAYRSACHGDSGGPVVYNGIQIGVVSWGKNCQRPDVPAVYANVYSLRDWIHENSGV